MQRNYSKETHTHTHTTKSPLARVAKDSWPSEHTSRPIHPDVFSPPCARRCNIFRSSVCVLFCTNVLGNYLLPFAREVRHRERDVTNYIRVYGHATNVYIYRFWIHLTSQHSSSPSFSSPPPAPPPSSLFPYSLPVCWFLWNNFISGSDATCGIYIRYTFTAQQPVPTVKFVSPFNTAQWKFPRRRYTMSLLFLFRRGFTPWDAASWISHGEGEEEGRAKRTRMFLKGARFQSFRVNLREICT